jgi:integration host factor subunit alpha
MASGAEILEDEESQDLPGSPLTQEMYMSLTKSRMISEINRRLGFSKKESADVVENLLEIMKRSLENGEDVLVSGFGKFCVREKKARKGRNPATGNDLILRERRVVTFKYSGKLRERINNGNE